MKQVVIINADFDKSANTQALIDAYREGAESVQAFIKTIVITDLKFNPNKQMPGRISEPEPDLTDAITKIKWASHIVIFCPVYKESINFRIKGFFDRVFLPDQVFVTPGNNFNTDFGGRSARIVSILDEEAWREWRVTQHTTFLAVKRAVLEKRRINPVHTSTIGYLYSLENDYAKKWLQKMHGFGEKLI